MAVYFVGEKSVGELNYFLNDTLVALLQGISVTLQAFILVILDLLAALDGVLTAEFGLGGLKAALEVQYLAALGASLKIGAALGNPLEYLATLINAAMQLVAQFQALLAGGPGPINVALNAQLSAAGGLAAALKLQIAGIQAIIDLVLLVQKPVLEGKAEVELLLGDLASLTAQLQADLAVSGGIKIFRLEGPAATVAAELATAWAGGFNINAAAQVKTLLVVVETSVNATAFATLSSFLLTSDPAETSYP